MYSTVSEPYVADIITMSDYYNTKTIPPIEPLVKFNEKFSANWNVQYSKYLTHTYGFETKQAYSDYALPLTTRWNRVLIRMNEGKDLTPDNIKAIEEMRKMGFKIEWRNETLDIPHEEVAEPKAKESAAEKLDELKNHIK